MMWPFSCRGCKAKDSEISFYRSFLSTMRSTVRDPSQDPERRQTVDYEALEGLAGLAKREAYFDSERDRPQPPVAFSRNPIQNAVETPQDDDEPVGVPV